MKKVWIIILTLITLSFPLKQLFADSSQDVTASVTVPPRTSDYQFSFASTDSATQFSQGQTLTYQITYGAKSSGNISSHVTLVANFSGDTAPDNTDVLNYVSGSATNAYNSTPAVIDTINRTITWTISSFPAGITDQVVSFQLMTNSNYKGATTVPLTITASMSNQYITLPTQTVNQSYFFDASLVTPTPTPSPTPAASTPTPTPQPGQTNTPFSGAPITPTTIPTNATPASTDNPPPTPVFTQNISIVGITQNSGTIEIQTSRPAVLTIFYGTSPSNLTQSLSTGAFATYSQITIPGLTATTNYYFQVVATTSSGQKITSDIFIFKTAILSTPPTIENGTIVISNNDVIVSSQNTSPSLQNTTNARFVSVVTKGTTYQFVLTIPNPQKVESIQAVVRNKNTLAIDTFNQNNGDTASIAMVETEQGVYVAKLIAPLHAGTYEVYARITDFNGNIVEQKIAELRVISPLIVYEKGTHEPLDDARAYFYFYNTKTKKYEPLSKSFGDVQNPSYSDTSGSIYVSLSKGKYQVRISALGYEQQLISFELGTNTGQDFPQIYLRKDPWNILSVLTYYGNALGDMITRIGAAVLGLSISLRFFNLLELITVSGFVFISLLFFIFRTHISLQRIPIFLHHHVSLLLKAKVHPYFYGVVLDEENHPLSNAHVYGVDPISEAILMTSTTSINGSFYLKNLRRAEVIIRVLAQGYEECEIKIDMSVPLVGKGMPIILHKGETFHFSGITLLWDVIKDALGVLFETMLFLSIILEFLFLSVFGFWKTFPFFILSFLNISLWILYIRASLSRK